MASPVPPPPLPRSRWLCWPVGAHVAPSRGCGLKPVGTAKGFLSWQGRCITCGCWAGSSTGTRDFVEAKQAELYLLSRSRVRRVEVVVLVPDRIGGVSGAVAIVGGQGGAFTWRDVSRKEGGLDWDLE